MALALAAPAAPVAAQLGAGTTDPVPTRPRPRLGRITDDTPTATPAAPTVPRIPVAAPRASATRTPAARPTVSPSATPTAVLRRTAPIATPTATPPRPAAAASRPTATPAPPPSVPAPVTLAPTRTPSAAPTAPLPTRAPDRAIPADRPVPPTAIAALERRLAAAARDGRWDEVLSDLHGLAASDPARYASGRFDYLAARALASSGRTDEAIARFERFVSTGDLLDVPARLAVGKLRFAKGDGLGALEVLAPLLARGEGAVARRALRSALDALETSFDAAALERLVAVAPSVTPSRERRRLLALRAEGLELNGDAAGAAALRREILVEARRDDAAAIVLARELRELTPASVADDLLALLGGTARAQRDLELAERLARERDRRAFARPPAAESDRVERLAARFDLARLVGSRGRFADAEALHRSVLEMAPAAPPPGRGPKDDAPPAAGFFARARFNLALVLEKQARLDEAVVEFRHVESGGVGPARLAALQRARLETRRGNLRVAEAILGSPFVAREPGMVEGSLLLLSRSAEVGEPGRAARVLARLETLARARRLDEPWRSELPFWRGRVAEASRDLPRAFSGYAEALALAPRGQAAAFAKERLRRFPPATLASLLQSRRARGLALLAAEPKRAKDLLLPPAILGDRAALEGLRAAYRRIPRYAAVLSVPALDDDALAGLCGDAAACRLIQLGLEGEAEPIVRDALRLDSLIGCVVASRLAERADAGPAALQAAETLLARIPADFLLELAPPVIAQALAPRPFDRLVTDSAERTGVPKDLLYSVMRQESRFDREAVSPAAARGLMQLTLPAAGEAARDLNEEAPAYLDLYDPARSLNLGAQTVRRLLERFAGDAPSVVAAYNAGAGQTTLWSGGASVPGEALLAAISYPETRVYFRRVLANQRLYEATAAQRGSEPGPARNAGAGTKGLTTSAGR